MSSRFTLVRRAGYITQIAAFTMFTGSVFCFVMLPVLYRGSLPKDFSAALVFKNPLLLSAMSFLGGAIVLALASFALKRIFNSMFFKALGIDSKDYNNARPLSIIHRVRDSHAADSNYAYYRPPIESDFYRRDLTVAEKPVAHYSFLDLSRALEAIKNGICKKIRLNNPQGLEVMALKYLRLCHDNPSVVEDGLATSAYLDDRDIVARAIKYEGMADEIAYALSKIEHPTSTSLLEYKVDGTSIALKLLMKVAERDIKYNQRDEVCVFDAASSALIADDPYCASTILAYNEAPRNALGDNAVTRASHASRGYSAD